MTHSGGDDLRCRRCGRGIDASRTTHVIEQMHRICFHYEFEHDPVDVDDECRSPDCPSRRVRLTQTLAEWTDWDYAALALGRAVGVYQGEDEWASAKGTFWTDNPLGNGLHRALVDLTRAGVLEACDDPDQRFRWSTR
ncbi:MAG TPA: hypothetical protein VF230_16605 [Acidimicrobiales bacterium]